MPTFYLTLKYFALTILLTACGRETKTKPTVIPAPFPLPADVLPSLYPASLDAGTPGLAGAGKDGDWATRQAEADTSVTLPNGTILTHEHCKTLNGDAKFDCTNLLVANALCAKESDKMRVDCEKRNVSDYLILTNDDNSDGEYDD